MKAWPKWTLRVVGVLDLLLALLGIVLFVHSVMRNGGIFVLHPERFVETKAPYVLQVYWIDMVVDLVCLLFLTLTGLSVVRLKQRGLWMSNTLFIFEIAEIVLSGFVMVPLMALGGKPQLIALSIAGAAGIGHPGVNLQVLIGYPIWALIATNIAYRKLDGRKKA